MKLKTKIIIYVVAAIIAVLIIARTSSYIMGSWSCSSEWKESGMEYKFGLRSGCMVKPKDHWIPAKNYRY